MRVSKPVWMPPIESEIQSMGDKQCPWDMRYGDPIVSLWCAVLNDHYWQNPKLFRFPVAFKPFPIVLKLKYVLKKW